MMTTTRKLGLDYALETSLLSHFYLLTPHTYMHMHTRTHAHAHTHTRTHAHAHLPRYHDMEGDGDVIKTLKASGDTTVQRILETCTGTSSAECNAAAREAFVQSGVNTAAEFPAAQRRGARDAMLEELMSCNRLIATGKASSSASTETVLSCKASAEAVFTRSGGDAAVLSRDLQAATEKAGADVYDTCLALATPSATAAATSASNNGKNRRLGGDGGGAPTPTITGGVARECMAQARDFLVEAGIGETDVPVRMMQGATTSAGKMKAACLQEAADQANSSTATGAATASLRKAACFTKAKKSFVQAGGDPQDGNSKLEEAKAVEAASSIEACTLVGDADCEASARVAHASFGGNGDRFETDVRRGAGKAAQEDFAVCVATEKKPRAECNVRATATFLRCGGRAEDREVALREAIKNAVRDLRAICGREEARIPSSSSSSHVSPSDTTTQVAQKAAAQTEAVKQAKQKNKECYGEISRKYREWGGDPNAFASDKVTAR